MERGRIVDLAIFWFPGLGRRGAPREGGWVLEGGESHTPELGRAIKRENADKRDAIGL